MCVCTVCVHLCVFCKFLDDAGAVQLNELVARSTLPTVSFPMALGHHQDTRSTETTNFVVKIFLGSSRLSARPILCICTRVRSSSAAPAVFAHVCVHHLLRTHTHICTQSDTHVHVPPTIACTHTHMHMHPPTPTHTQGPGCGYEEGRPVYHPLPGNSAPGAEPAGGADLI